MPDQARTWRLGLILGLALGASPAFAQSSRAAAPLPSQLVTLLAPASPGENKSELCPSGTGFAFDRQIKADGSASPFTIPGGVVLVATNFYFQAFGVGSGGVNYTPSVFLESGGSVGNPVVGVTALLDATGSGGAQTTLLYGAVARAGTVLCLEATATTRAFIHGYLTADH